MFEYYENALNGIQTYHYYPKDRALSTFLLCFAVISI